MSEDDRNKKILLMKIGVAVFTIVILFIWIFNLKNVWRNERQTSSVNNQTSWLKLKTDLDKTLGGIQRQLNQMNQAGVSQKSSSTNFLVNLVKNSKQNVSPSHTTTSPAMVTTTVAVPATIVPRATSSVVNHQKNCPKYINCMPTTDGLTHSCQIPPACKNITTLVY